MKLCRVFFVGLLVVALTGCSIKLFYNNADRYARWQIQDYVDLDREQRATLSVALKEILAWHRVEHLPLYAEHLAVFRSQVADEPNAELMATFFGRFEDWAYEVQDRFLPPLAALFSSLSDEQLERLPDRLQESNDELLEPEVDGTLAEQQSRWADELIDAIQRFTGRLNGSQRESVQRQASAYQPERALWVEYRERWQTDFLTLLKQRADASFETQFAEHVNNLESYKSETYKKISAENEALAYVITASVLGSLSDRQATRLDSRLEDLGQDLVELSRQE